MASVWAKNELEYITYLNKPEWKVDFQLTVENKLREFKPVFMESQFQKQFPRKPSKILVGWMADLSTVPRSRVYTIMDKIHIDNLKRKALNLKFHTFFFLTKSPEYYGNFEWPVNCWTGMTYMGGRGKDREDIYLPPGAKSFLVMEPLEKEPDPQVLNMIQLFDWVIVGGGPKPLNPQWVRSVRDQCQAAGVPFHFKGWGKWLDASQSYNNEMHRAESSHKIEIDSMGYWKVGKGKSGNTLDGKQHLEGPEVG
jgi:protein gp37